MTIANQQQENAINHQKQDETQSSHSPNVHGHGDNTVYELGKEMNKAYREMKQSLGVFFEDKSGYEALLDETQCELLNSGRIVKREVIDMSDMMDKMCGVMLK